MQGFGEVRVAVPHLTGNMTRPVRFVIPLSGMLRPPPPAPITWVHTRGCDHSDHRKALRMLQVEVEETRRKLAALPFPAVLAFAAACIERTFPCLERYYAATPCDAIGLERIAQARDTIWSATLDPIKAVSDARRLLPDCEARLIDEDQAFSVGVPAAEDAGACIVYGLRLVISRAVEHAVWIAQRLYDATDRVAVTAVDGPLLTAGDEARILAHPAVQAELHRQQRDLSELGATAGNNGTWPAQCARMRSRALTEAADFFCSLGGRGQ